MSSTMAWIALIASGLIDVAWVLAMKKADGFANPQWSAISVVLLAVFVILLTKALQVLPVGTAYAVWTGIGAVGTVLVGIFAFGESADAVRLLCIGLIVAGIAGLKVVTP